MRISKYKKQKKKKEKKENKTYELSFYKRVILCMFCSKSPFRERHTDKHI